MKFSEKAQASLDAMVERFQDGDISPLVQVALIGLPEDAPCRKWTFTNRVMAFGQTGSPDCRGYKQWQSVGRQVSKGSRASYILGPVLKKEVGDDGEETTRLVTFHCIPVFPYSSTEPIDPDNPETLTYEPREVPPLADVAAAFGIEVRYEPTGAAGAEGFYFPSADTIAVGTENDAFAWFHELAHAMHKRVVGSLKDVETDHSEVVADLTACVLMAMYELGDRTGNAWEYICRFAKDPIIAIRNAATEVGAILALLFDDKEDADANV